MEAFDACVGLKWVLAEPDSDKARTIRDELRAGVRDLIAPDVFAAECAHALTKAQRRGLVTGAGKLYINIMMDSPRLFSSVPLMGRAIEIATIAGRKGDGRQKRGRAEKGTTGRKGDGAN